jgi:hypothetical protein
MDKQEAFDLCAEAIVGRFDFNSEVDNIFKHFSQYGDIVDLNLDYFPDFIAVTYAKHESVLKLLKAGEIFYNTSTKRGWVFIPSKINFMLPVRNCKSSSMTAS